MQQFFKKMFLPGVVKEEKMRKFWEDRPKTVRIVVEFENGIKKELVGDDAEKYAKSLFWIQCGWTHLWKEIAELTWHRTN